MPSNADTILVTGATGFVGLNLLHHLGPTPYTIVGMANRPLPEPARRSLTEVGDPPTIEHVDVRDAAAVSDVFKRHRPAVVIHAAAITAGPDRERTQARTIVDVNAGGTQSVLDACTDIGAVRLVHVSSGAVYGPATFGDEVLDEDTKVQPNSLYGITKLAAEQLVRRHRELHGLDAVIGRLSAVFGPWEYPSGVRDFMSPMLQLVTAAAKGEAIRTVVDAPRNWVYAPDAAQALIDIALAPSPGADCYNVCPDTTMTVSAFAERLRAAHPDLDAAIVDRPEEATIGFDADPRRERAPVSGRRLAEEFGDRRWTTPTEAADDYINWARSNPSWLEPPPSVR